MKTIVIGFSKSKKTLAIGSWFIRKWLKTPYSHVYMKFKSESLDRTLIYEAIGQGVRFVGQSVWEKHSEEVSSFNIEINEEDRVNLLKYCVDNAGLEYGFLQNFGVVIAKLLKLNKNPFTKYRNCSEEIALFLEKKGITIGKDVNLVTPKDIYLALEVLSLESKEVTKYNN